MTPTEAGDWIPLPAPDPMDEVVGRVRGYMDSFKDDLQTPEERQAYEDVSALLAAYQSVRSERDALREAIDYVVDCDDSKWVQYFKDELAEIDARRTGGTE